MFPVQRPERNSLITRNSNVNVQPEECERIPFGPGGCEAKVNGVKCGETQTLTIINEFKSLYEQKMKEIDTISGDGCSKVRIYICLHPRLD